MWMQSRRVRGLQPGTHYPHVTWAHVMLCVQLGCERRFNIEFYGADWHVCHSAYVTWSRVQLWSAHVPARLSNFCCRTHFVRRDVRVERSSDVTSCFQKWRKCSLKKGANGPFDITPSHHIMEISIWEPTHGKELKIKRKFKWAHVTWGWCVPGLREADCGFSSLSHHGIPSPPKHVTWL
jgi:hypothetical protein